LDSILIFEKKRIQDSIWFVVHCKLKLFLHYPKSSRPISRVYNHWYRPLFFSFQMTSTVKALRNKIQSKIAWRRQKRIFVSQVKFLNYSEEPVIDEKGNFIFNNNLFYCNFCQESFVYEKLNWHLNTSHFFCH